MAKKITAILLMGGYFFMSICSSVLLNTVKIMKIINRSIVISITPSFRGMRREGIRS